MAATIPGRVFSEIARAINAERERQSFFAALSAIFIDSGGRFIVTLIYSPPF